MAPWLEKSLDCADTFYFDNWQAMEEAWATPEGQRATNDLEAFVDLSQTTWSPVEEAVFIE
jgi:hypothetical protein